MANPITDAELKNAVANILQVDPSGLPAFWDDLVSKANVAAYQDVYTGLVTRGFSIAQISGWDRMGEFVKDIGLYWSLLRGGALGSYGEGYKGLDRRKELDTVTVTVNGFWQQPGNTPPANTETAFQEVNQGQQSTGTDLFSFDPNDVRAGQITRW